MTQRSASCVARTSNPSISSQALYNRAPHSVGIEPLYMYLQVTVNALNDVLTSGSICYCKYIHP